MTTYDVPRHQLLSENCVPVGTERAKLKLPMEKKELMAKVKCKWDQIITYIITKGQVGWGGGLL